jgi:hypothetical protein
LRRLHRVRRVAPASVQDVSDAADHEHVGVESGAPQEVDRLVEAMYDPTDSYAAPRTNHRYQALVFMSAWLGPRRNEAIGLRICDITRCARS